MNEFERGFEAGRKSEKFLMELVDFVLPSHLIALVEEACDIAQEHLDDYASQWSDVDQRIDGGKTRADAQKLRDLGKQLRERRVSYSE